MAVVNSPAFDSVYAIQEAAICNKALSRIGAEVIRDTDEDTKQSRICKAIYAQTRDELLRLYPFNFAQKTRYIPLDLNYNAPTGLYAYAFKAWDYQNIVATYTTGNPVISVPAGVLETDILLAIFGQDIPDGARVIDVDILGNTLTLDRAPIANGTDVVLRKYIPLLKIVHIGGNNNNLYELIGSGENGRVLTNIMSDNNVLEIRCVEQIINPDLFDSIFSDALVLRIAMKIAISFTQSAGLVSLLYQEFAQILQTAKIASAEEKELEAPDDYYATYSTQSNVRRR